ncbi:MAG: ABC transporter ATP-binding protein, partial [Proteobacteria bacterium]|nr:ABC transporter ATP-binding protein [Pseudomonadota bacterium]
MYALEVRNISKIFRVYPKPVDRLKEILFRRSFHQEFIALERISFSVPIGQTVGIIGDNGAGKSTLLKILAGTLTPTSGEVIKRGLVAALLELGAGFHPEFTGRQNIYLNAALLGLKESEIRALEEDIIDFAELREFIDRPVKTYSSGMYVRLAFSIATSVNPDILIIDEALSVGDQRFQKKCIDRMMGFRNSGKTIVFCSHSMYHISTLCQKTLWIDDGKIRMSGEAEDIVRSYEDWAQEKTKVYAAEHSELVSETSSKVGNPCLIRSVAIESLDGESLEEISLFQDVRLRMEIEPLENGVEAHFGFAIFRNDDLLCFCAMTTFDGFKETVLKAGQKITVILIVRGLSLLDGKYRVMGGIADEYGLHVHHYTYSKPFSVANTGCSGLGVVTFPRKWQIDGA